jgi:ribosomal protein S3AE
MRCASDYDNDEQAMFRQADECVEEWWESEGRNPDRVIERAVEVPQGDVTAETEARRRGLLSEDESGNLCLSCPEKME